MKITKNNYYFFLISIIIIFFVDSIFYGYIWDDFWLTTITLDEIINKTFNSYLIRPVMFFSYYLSNLIFKSSIFDHLINILLFIYLIKLMFDFTRDRFNKKAAFLIILFWIFLPWVSHTIIWISQRNDTLMLIFFFLALKQLKNDKIVSSGFFLLLSLLSKLTVFLAPIYFIFKSKNNKFRLFFFSILQMFFLYVAYLSYKRGLQELKHINELSFIENIFLKFYHLAEGLLTQIIPIPYFVNFYHFIIYLSTLVLIFYALKRQKINLKKTLTDSLFLFFIFWMPLSINSELRVAIPSSFFLIYTCGHLFNYADKKLQMAFGILFLFNLTTTFYSKSNFKSLEFDQTKYLDEPENDFYNNSYYKSKKEFLLKVKNRLNEKISTE